MSHLSCIGIGQQTRSFSSKTPAPAIPRPPGLNFGGLSLFGIAEQNKTFDQKVVFLSGSKLFISKNKIYSFKAINKKSAFNAKDKTNNFITKKQ
jgi:hypothetical protein